MSSGGFGKFLMIANYLESIEETEFLAASKAGSALSSSIYTTYCFSLVCLFLISNYYFNKIDSCYDLLALPF